MNLLAETRRQIARNVLFPAQEKIKGHTTLGLIRQMEGDERLAPKVLQQVQSERLRQLLTRAYGSVPYYRSIFDRLGIGVDQINCAADLGILPLLSKELIREHLESLKSTEAGQVEKFATGGSTGKPLIFYLGSTRVSSDVAARARAEGWWGVGIGDPEIVIWGSPLELSKQDRIRSLRDKLMGTKLLSAFEMDVATMDRYIDEIRSVRPAKLFGYPSSIALLAERASSRGIDLKAVGVKVVFVTAEYLHDHWKAMIESAFGCRTANGYGGRDSGFIAHQCPAGGMHITADRMVVEIIREDGSSAAPGELGEIVVTHFDTWEMPFIRYATGDMGAISNSACSCGRTLPLLERVEGRKTDFVFSPDGRILHGLSLVYVLRPLPGVEQFRITQKAVDSFVVEIVAGPAFQRSCETQIRREFEQRMRASLTIKIDYVDKIHPTASGKYRYVVNDIQNASAVANMNRN